MGKKKTKSDYHALAESRDCRWVAEVLPENSKQKTTWLCSNEHRFLSQYNSLQQGHGCSTCSGTKKKTTKDFMDLAQSKNAQWVGPKVINSTTSANWRCLTCNNNWQTTFSSLQGALIGCPICSQRHVAEKLRLDNSQYRALGNKKGFQWLSEKCSSVSTKTEWRCSDGHNFFATYNNISKGNGCPHCYGNAKKTNSSYQEIANKYGITWLGKVPSHSKAKTGWQCKKGHIYQSSYSAVSIGKGGCLECSGLAPKISTDYEVLAIQFGFTWSASEIPGNTKLKTKWQCSNYHVFDSSYNSIQGGHGCPRCSKNLPISIESYEKLALNRSFCWIGIYPKSSQFNTQWKCAADHSWYASYSTVKKGHGCPHCAGKARKIVADYEKLAAIRGFTWESDTLPPTTLDKTNWGCSKGHVWDARYADIAHNESGCPKCIDVINGSPVSKVQREVNDLVSGELNYREGRFAIDIALTYRDTKIAIEYDSWYFHAHKLESDKSRAKMLIERGWVVLSIKGNRLAPSKEQLFNVLDEMVDCNKKSAELILADWRKGNTLKYL